MKRSDKKIITGGLSGLKVLKDDMPDLQQLDDLQEKHGDKAYLISPGSRKVLAHLFDQYPKEVKTFVRAKQATRFERELRAHFKKNTNLPAEHLELIHEMLPYLLKSVPVTEHYNKSVHGDLAKRAGCTGEEVEEAVKVLSLYNDEAIQKAFQKIMGIKS